MHDGHPFHQVGEKYIRAVTDGIGGIPLEIPVLADHLDIEELLGLFDGILFSGSPSDIEPHHYAGTPSAPGTLHDADRDALTLPLARRALEAGVPVFAICRGFQELNVARGGSLHQKVADVPGYHSHKENPEDPLEVQYGPSHDVVLVEGWHAGWEIVSRHPEVRVVTPDALFLTAFAQRGLIAEWGLGWLFRLESGQP